MVWPITKWLSPPSWCNDHQELSSVTPKGELLRSVAVTGGKLISSGSWSKSTGRNPGSLLQETLVSNPWPSFLLTLNWCYADSDFIRRLRRWFRNWTYSYFATYRSLWNLALPKLKGNCRGRTLLQIDVYSLGVIRANKIFASFTGRVIYRWYVNIY